MNNIPPLDGAFYVDRLGINISHLFKPEQYNGQEILPLTIEMAVKLIEKKTEINVLTVVVENNRVIAAAVDIGVTLDCIRCRLHSTDPDAIPISFIMEQKS